MLPDAVPILEEAAEKEDPWLVRYAEDEVSDRASSKVHQNPFELSNLVKTHHFRPLYPATLLLLTEL